MHTGVFTQQSQNQTIRLYTPMYTFLYNEIKKTARIDQSQSASCYIHTSRVAIYTHCSVAAS